MLSSSATISNSAALGGMHLPAVSKPLVVKDAKEEYYAGINFDETDDALKKELHDLINPHTVISYDNVWNAFIDVDHYLPTYPCSDNTTEIPDIYSSYCWPKSKQCGNYKQEGDCYNREHIWPKSWFGGMDAGKNAETDLYELWPSDGYVNGLRGNLPLGKVIPSTATYTSTNGCIIGTCASDDYDGKCFEPVDLYKGDIARSYFYLSVAYMDEWTCCDEAATDKWNIKPWAESELREWHELDPVDDSEIARNEDIFTEWQHNRNPFIDYPDLVYQIADF